MMEVLIFGDLEKSGRYGVTVAEKRRREEMKTADLYSADSEPD